MPFRRPSDDYLTSYLMLLDLTTFSRWPVRFTADTVGVGTRKASKLPTSAGMSYILHKARGCREDALGSLRASHHSLSEGSAIVFWVVVMAWSVATSP